MHTNTCGEANHTLMMQEMVRATPFPGKFSQFCPINHHLPLKNRLSKQKPPNYTLPCHNTAQLCNTAKDLFVFCNNLFGLLNIK